MSRRTVGLSLALAGAVGLAHGVEIETTDPIESATDYSITVPAGTTNVYSGKITIAAKGYLDVYGGGMLALTNPENSFGHVRIRDNSQVRIDAQGAQGSDSGMYYLQSGDKSRILFNCDGLVFKNTIEAKKHIDSTKVCAVGALKDVTCNSKMSGLSFSFGTLAPSVTAVWNGTITFYTRDSSTYAHTIKAIGTNIVNGTILSSLQRPIYTDMGAERVGCLCFNASNEFSGIQFTYTGVSCGAEGALGGGYLTHTRGSDAKEGVFLLNGYDQRLTYITNACVTAGRIPGVLSTGSRFESTEPATVTLTGGEAGGEATSLFMFATNVSLVCDFKEPTFCQIFRNRNHQTRRAVEVKRGILCFNGETSWPVLSTLAIGAEGVLTNATTAAKSLVGLKTLDLAGTFVQTADEEGATPFGDALENVTLTGETARLEMPSDCILSTQHLYTNGVELAKGTYEAPCAALPQLAGGTIKVTVGRHSGLVILAR